jgi:prevent-host-death family protein
MPIIKPISDLRNKTNEIVELVHEKDEPIFLTKNCKSDMVIMSLAHYSRIQQRLILFKQLLVAQAQYNAEYPTHDLATVVLDLRKKINRNK